MTDSKVSWTEEVEDEYQDVQLPPEIPAKGKLGSSLAPPAADPPKGRISRSPSPARITGALTARIADQSERAELLQDIAATLAHEDNQDPTLTDCLQWEKQVEEIYHEFVTAHDTIVSQWPTGNLNHPYFKDRLLRVVTNSRNNCNLVLARHKAIKALISTDSAQSVSAPTAAKLPPLDVPKFSGALLGWTNFAEMFRSLVLEEARIPEVQKLQYLKMSLEGEPARLVAGFSLQEGQLELAWKTLTVRYEDKHRMIVAYLDRALDLKPCTSGKTKELLKVFNVISEGAKTVKSLACNRDVGDIFWAHLMARNLDSALRQDLEFSLGNTDHPPTFQEVEEFVRRKLRAIETTDSSREESARKPAQKTAQKQSGGTARSATSLQVSAPSSSASYKGYACDCCNGSHYIATCTTYLAKSPKDRRSFVIEKRLCFNCLGRHSAKVCRNTRSCRSCNGKHHTLLHEASLHNAPAPAPTAASAAAPKAAQSENSSQQK